MLLDRKRIKFWQRWVFLAMAILMASFLIFGYSGLAQGCTNRIGLTSEAVDQVQALKDRIAASPGDAQLLRDLAEAYQIRAGGKPDGSSERTADLQAAAQNYQKYLKATADEKGAEARTERIDTLEQLAAVYLQLGRYEDVVAVYGRLTDIRPKEAEYYLQMGQFAEQGGDTKTALLAYSRFLQLDPQSEYAALVKKKVKSLTAALSASNVVAPTPSPSQ